MVIPGAPVYELEHAGEVTDVCLDPSGSVAVSCCGSEVVFFLRVSDDEKARAAVKGALAKVKGFLKSRGQAITYAAVLIVSFKLIWDGLSGLQF